VWYIIKEIALSDVSSAANDKKRLSKIFRKKVIKICVVWHNVMLDQLLIPCSSAHSVTILANLLSFL
jgi:hypothetical protein